MKSKVLNNSIIIFTVLLLTAFTPQKDFLSEQKKFERVRKAIDEKGNIVANNLKQAGLRIDNFNLLLVAYKAESCIDLFVKLKSETAYKRIVSYSICARSGKLGPKRQYGDYQVPEGFYHIAQYNPASSYYLSLGLNYPNQSDRKKSKASNRGGDIYIHGSCVTIGCMPMTDDKIKEIYLYAIYAKQNGQNSIPVYVFPFKMDEQNFTQYQEKYSSDTELISFWKNIKQGFDIFTKTNKELKYTVDKNGNYCF